MKRLIHLITCTVTLAAFSLDAFSATEIGVRFVVDNELVTATRDKDDIRDEVDFWIAEVNSIYSNSNASLKIVNTELVFKDISDGGSITAPGDIFDNLENETQGFQGLEARAKELGADYTVAVLKALDNICGQAATVSRTQDELNAKDFVDSTALSEYGCGEDTLSHEIGHLMGLAHGDIVATATNKSSHSNGLNAYSKGWGVIVSVNTKDDVSSDESLQTGEYGTIMVGNYIKYWTGTTGSGVKVPLFSNPSVKDSRCGVNSSGNALACGNSSSGDAARAMRENASKYAGHQTIDVHAVDYLSGELQDCIEAQYPNNSSNDNTDVDKISYIYCPTKKIRSIYGIQKVVGLVKKSSASVDLRNNAIVGLSALESLHSSAVIDLRGNNVADCHQLNKLQKSHINTKAPSSCLNVAAINAIF